MSVAVLEADVEGILLRLNDGAAPIRCGPDPAAAGSAWAELREQCPDIDRIELRITPGAIEAKVLHVGVVCSGLARRALERIALPARLAVGGQIDIHGVQQAPLSDVDLVTGIEKLTKGHRLDGFAVSGVNSNRNPLHERHMAACVREWSGLPVLEARFWGDALDAGRRATAAAGGLARLLLLFELQACAADIQTCCARGLTLRTAPLDGPLVSALLEAPEFAPLTALTSAVGPAGALQARITRGESGYICHCTDGRFEFESITLAREFAGRHLREQFARLAARLNRAAAGVDVQSHDRYTFVRGKRGPVRVYLETIVTAREA